MLDVVGVGGEQHQRAQARRADGVALGDGFGGVADRVERIGRLAHFLGHSRHFGDAAGVVGDWAEGVERDDHAGEAQHGRDRDGGAEQACELIRDDDAADDHQSGQGGRFQADREALNDVRAMAGDGGLGDRDHRALAGARVIFGDDHDQAGHDETDQTAKEQVGAGDRLARDVAERAPADDEVCGEAEADDRQRARGDQAAI